MASRQALDGIATAMSGVESRRITVSDAVLEVELRGSGEPGTGGRGRSGLSPPSSDGRLLKRRRGATGVTVPGITDHFRRE